MKIRLSFFAAALMLLPLLASILAGLGWPTVVAVADNGMPLLVGAVPMFACAFALDKLTAVGGQKSLWQTQRNFLLGSAAAGAGLGVLLGCLNLFADTWPAPANDLLPNLVLSGFVGIIFMPAVLVARFWLAGFFAKFFSRRWLLPTFESATSAAVLFLLALIGLMGGAVWPEKLVELFWLAPLLMLCALQLAWHESTIFSGLAHGDWSRIALGALAGLLVGGVGVLGFALSGGAVSLSFSALLLPFFGLLCLQLSDVVAEFWRGKQGAKPNTRKPFPIPVVVKK